MKHFRSDIGWALGGKLVQPWDKSDVVNYAGEILAVESRPLVFHGRAGTLPLGGRRRRPAQLRFDADAYTRTQLRPRLRLRRRTLPGGHGATQAPESASQANATNAFRKGCHARKPVACIIFSPC